MTKLPEEFIKRNYIAGMIIGQTVYVTPWTLIVDEDGDCLLDPFSTYHDRPGGTVDMKVLRMADGYHVWLCDWFKYEPKGHCSGGMIPVAEIHRKGE